MGDRAGYPWVRRAPSSATLRTRPSGVHSYPCRCPPHRHCEDAGRSSLKQAERDQQIVPLRAANAPIRQTPIPITSHSPSLRGRRTKQSHTSGERPADYSAPRCQHANMTMRQPANSLTRQYAKLPSISQATHRHCEDAGRSSLIRAERDQQIVPLRPANSPTRQHANTPTCQHANMPTR